MKDISIVIAVATHKKYKMPVSKVYLPVQAGSALHEAIGYTKDNTGDNISIKNSSFCELTVLYWLWKNVNANYLGIVHYRRHFTKNKLFVDKWKRILSEKDFQNLLSDTDILLPKPRNYLIETNYSQYIHAHHKADLDITKQILQEKYPEYIGSWNTVMNRTWGHRFNMFIMKNELLDSYCTWLFDILFELEKRLDLSTYNEYDRRVFGFVSERLLDIWIETNKYSYKEIPFSFMEKQNWIIKGSKFLIRKATGKNE